MLKEKSFKILFQNQCIRKALELGLPEYALELSEAAEMLYGKESVEKILKTEIYITLAAKEIKNAEQKQKEAENHRIAAEIYVEKAKAEMA